VCRLSLRLANLYIAEKANTLGQEFRAGREVDPADESPENGIDITAPIGFKRFMRHGSKLGGTRIPLHQPRKLEETHSRSYLKLAVNLAIAHLPPASFLF
jgi:hypothetical protein